MQFVSQLEHGIYVSPSDEKEQKQPCVPETKTKREREGERERMEAKKGRDAKSFASVFAKELSRIHLGN